MQKMDILPVDPGNELWKTIQFGFLFAPIELVTPVSGQLFEIANRNAPAPVVDGKLMGPPSSVKPVMKVI